MALRSASNCWSCACACSRDISAAWCSLRVMRSSMSSNSCSLHFRSRSTPSYCEAADLTFSSWDRTLSKSFFRVCTSCSSWESSCNFMRMLPPFGAEPPVIVPAGSYTSPSFVTERTRTLGWKLTCLAVSGVSHTRKPPKTYFMALSTSFWQPMISNAQCSSPPCGMIFLACLTVPAGMVGSTILFKGMIVTRRRSWPRSSRALPVSSLSVTTKKRRPPAQTSSARW
mmetsp:Transcript_84460/g.247699  ORF Transcript_84460/g.247699 Transcript_84460/m.247699 type:complete len:227 (-) Transcript_84460:1713-2393(-)